MDHRIPKAGVVLGIVAAVLAAITFLYLNEAFEGPSPLGALRGEPYELKARFHDTEALPVKAPVLVRGLQVGKVTDVEFEHASSTADVTFSVDDEAAPVHRDATATIGERTLLGDPYLDLDPGSEPAGDLDAGGLVDGQPSVDFDEALSFLDERGRRHVRSTIGTLHVATRVPASGERLNQTVSELARTVRNLRDLTDALRGQRSEIAGLARDGATVLGELGDRERALRSIVASGRSALGALASGRRSLSSGLRELPGLLATTRRALTRARPLIAAARPVVRGLRHGAPALVSILTDVGPLAGDAISAVSGLAGIPTLRKTLVLVNLLKPVAPKLAPTARNLVSIVRYAAPRAPGLAAFFANLGSVTAHGDSVAKWARFAILFEPGEVLDQPTPARCHPEDDVPVNAGFCHNAYPPPGDAAANEPYQPGAYPRLHAFRPPR